MIRRQWTVRRHCVEAGYIGSRIAPIRPLSFIDVPEQIYIDGLIGVYELNRVELLRDVYLWYDRSSRRYNTVCEWAT
jgi:hypothetical protein